MVTWKSMSPPWNPGTMGPFRTGSRGEGPCLIEMLGSFRLFASEIFLKEKRHAVNLPCTSSFDFGAYYQDCWIPLDQPCPKKLQHRAQWKPTSLQPSLCSGIHSCNMTHWRILILQPSEKKGMASRIILYPQEENLERILGKIGKFRTKKENLSIWTERKKTYRPALNFPKPPLP